MKKAALVATLLLSPALLLLPGAPPARAGSAKPGGTTTVTIHRGTKAQRILGQWRLAYFQLKGHRQPMVGSLSVEIDFQPGGQVVATTGSGGKPRREVGTWSIKGSQLYIRTKNKTEIMPFHFKGQELILTPPKQHHLTLIFVRPKPTP